MKNKLAEWFENRYLDILYSRRLVRNLYISVKNLIKWFPTIWNDRQWDHYFTFIVLRTKLQFQADYLEKNDNHTMASYDVSRIRTCIRLIDKIVESSYSTEYFEYCKVNYSFEKIENSNQYRMNSDEVYNNFSDYFEAYPLDYKRALKQFHLRYPHKKLESVDDFYTHGNTIAMLMSDIREARAKKLLFHLMEMHIMRWWD